jgi:hypothetical protein
MLITRNLGFKTLPGDRNGLAHWFLEPLKKITFEKIFSCCFTDVCVLKT